MAEKEILGVGRTFILAVLGLVATVVLVLAGKIPAEISIEGWSLLMGTVLVPYAAKSAVHGASKKKELQ